MKGKAKDSKDEFSEIYDRCLAQEIEIVLADFNANIGRKDVREEVRYFNAKIGRDDALDSAVGIFSQHNKES